VMETLIAYFEERRPPGDFVRAVLENDLVRAFALADQDSTAAMQRIAAWLYWEAPARSYGHWGSPEAVKRWLAGPQEEQADGL